METLGGIVVGCFIIYASWQSLGHGRSPGEFMAFIMAFLFAYEPAKRLAGFNVTFQRKLAAVNRMYKLLDQTEPDWTDQKNTIPLGNIRGELEFTDVVFGYVKKKPFLHGVSFKVSPGETLAIVGRSGSGKTTIANLILRLISPDSGNITLDGVDIGKVAFDELRKAVSLVSQDVFLFENTIRDNIRDGRPTASDDEIEEAARLSNVLEFADNLPAGLDTMVGPNAMNLSGGQKQRIAIARALLKASPVIIFDEATSSLDGESERTIINAQMRLSKDRSLIVVAHRLSTIRAADRIILLDDGYVIASGTHEELEQSSDLYRSLFHLGGRYGKDHEGRPENIGNAVDRTAGKN
jgi:ATP-binding cassette subfamily B protein